MFRASRVLRGGSGVSAARALSEHRGARCRRLPWARVLKAGPARGCPRCLRAVRAFAGALCGNLPLIFITEGGQQQGDGGFGGHGQGQGENEQSCSRHLILCTFSSSVSVESSMAESHDEMLQVLKEKTRLEGQLEALSLEASQVMDVWRRVRGHVLAVPQVQSPVSLKNELQQQPCRLSLTSVCLISFRRR